MLQTKHEYLKHMLLKNKKKKMKEQSQALHGNAGAMCDFCRRIERRAEP